MDLSVNRIRKLGFLSVLPDSLVVLDLSGNMLKNLGDSSVLPHLKDLMCEHLRKNSRSCALALNFVASAWLGIELRASAYSARCPTLRNLSSAIM